MGLVWCGQTNKIYFVKKFVHHEACSLFWHTSLFAHWQSSQGNQQHSLHFQLVGQKIHSQMIACEQCKSLHNRCGNSKWLDALSLCGISKVQILSSWWFQAVWVWKQNFHDDEVVANEFKDPLHDWTSTFSGTAISDQHWKGSAAMEGLVACPLRLQALHSRHCCGIPWHNFMPGQLNAMANEA